MEHLVKFLVFWFASYGAANIIVYSRLFQPFRYWIEFSDINNGIARTNKVAVFLSKLVNCILCSGFWVGVVFSLMFPISGNLLIDGALASAASWITYLLISDKMNGK